MIGFPFEPPWIQSALLVGVVLLEAVVLYVGYGVVERFVAPPLERLVKR